ncbi:MAG: HAMP domain-containing histidine kinase [Anaerolineae bacterium]|nr:HAMP domain-containing histidine kinase [Anaerolineae bacterium]
MARVLIGEFEGATDISALLEADPSITCEIVPPAQVLASFESLPPDLLILDANTHWALGSELNNYFNLNGHSAPAILALASDTHPSSEVQTAFNASMVITRPVQPTALLMYVERLLREHADTQAESLRERFTMQSDLFKMLIHDMGNAVMMINSALSFYNQVPPGSPEAVQAVYDAFDSGSLLESMTRDSLDVINVERREITVRRVTADLGQVTASLLKRFLPLTHDKDIKLVFEQQDDLNTFIELDPVLIWRAILNLLVNALKFSPSQSTITVSLTQGAQSNMLRIAIKDEGPGIDPTYISGLFDKESVVRQYKRHESRAGYGLGLVFCKLAIDAHNGRIFVESVPNGGSTFIIELPH